VYARVCTSEASPLCKDMPHPRQHQQRGSTGLLDVERSCHGLHAHMFAVGSPCPALTAHSSCCHTLAVALHHAGAC
jgi:hypothetical protein